MRRRTMGRLGNLVVSQETFVRYEWRVKAFLREREERGDLLFQPTFRFVFVCLLVKPVQSPRHLALKQANAA